MFDFIKMNVCSAKDTKNKKTSPRLRTFAKHASDEGLLCKTYKELKTQQENKQPMKKWVRELNKDLTQVDIQVANKHRERCCRSCVSKKCK